MELSVARLPRDVVGFDVIRNPALSNGEGVRYFQFEFDVFEDHVSIRREVRWVTGSQHVRERFFEATKHTIHATAVASIVKDNIFGIAPNVEYHFCGARSLLEWHGAKQQYLYSNLKQFEKALRRGGVASPGDVVCASLQTPIPVSGGTKIGVPIDFDDEVRKWINILVDKYGLIVFIAAGNSDVLLDDINNDIYQRPDRNYAAKKRQSRSIVVGAANNDGSAYADSNFGESVDLFVPAENITAACYNYDQSKRLHDLLDVPSLDFGRTSAATPMVAGFAALLQSAYKKIKGRNTFISRDMFLEFFRNEIINRKIAHERIVTQDIFRDVLTKALS